MSFGPPIQVQINEVTLTLRAPQRAEMAAFATLFSSARVHQWTMGGVSMATEDEEEWYDRTRQAPPTEAIVWVIQPEGAEHPVGVTSLTWGRVAGHVWSTGIIVADPAWWKKGVASAAHVARTWFAATQVHGLMVIQSEVRVPNEASWKALKRVGYLQTGRNLRDAYRDGAFHDTYQYTWGASRTIGASVPRGCPRHRRIC